MSAELTTERIRLALLGCLGSWAPDAFDAWLESRENEAFRRGYEASAEAWDRP